MDNRYFKMFIVGLGFYYPALCVFAVDVSLCSMVFWYKTWMKKFLDLAFTISRSPGSNVRQFYKKAPCFCCDNLKTFFCHYLAGDEDGRKWAPTLPSKTLWGSKNFFSLTASTLLADSVLESPCPSVCLFLCPCHCKTPTSGCRVDFWLKNGFLILACDDTI